jgi:hypothetical protein
MKLSCLLITLLLALISCSGNPPIVPTSTLVPAVAMTPTTSPTSIVTATSFPGPRLSPTPPPSSTATRAPTQTPLPTPVTMAPQSTAWRWNDRFDPSIPTLIEPSGNAFRIRTTWEITQVDYLYQWLGLGRPVRDYQQIKRSGPSFTRGSEPVGVEKITALVEALDRLYPTQFLLVGRGHTDDYPAWSIELTGTDKQHLLIYSGSTDNPGGGPWNILYNGRLYAQYEGALGQVLGQLFQSIRGQPAATYRPGGREQDHAYFSTSGLPAQLTYGYWGLLPVSDSFSYVADLPKMQIRGEIVVWQLVAGYADTVIGRITNPKNITLDQNGRQIACNLTSPASSDPSGAAWSFECPLDHIAEGDTFHYPIQIQYGTDRGTVDQTEGELYGKWTAEPNPVWTPPSDEIAAAFTQEPTAHQLMMTHLLGYASYSADINVNTPRAGPRKGESVWFGETAVGGKTLRYTLGTPFNLQDGKLTRWDLNESTIQQMLQTILALPLTRRVLGASSHPVINMWFANNMSQPKILGYLFGGFPREYQIEITPCGTMPGGRFPNDAQPLEAFSYNQFESFRLPDFVLIGNQAVVASLDLHPNQDTRDGALSVLTPAELQTGSAKPFDRIWMQSSALYPKGTELGLWLPSNTSPSEEGIYDKIASALPGQLTKMYGWWQVRGLTFKMTTDGRLVITSCN